jgi:hypothetical protein
VNKIVKIIQTGHETVEVERTLFVRIPVEWDEEQIVAAVESCSFEEGWIIAIPDELYGDPDHIDSTEVEEEHFGELPDNTICYSLGEDDSQDYDQQSPTSPTMDAVEEVGNEIDLRKRDLVLIEGDIAERKRGVFEGSSAHSGTKRGETTDGNCDCQHELVTALDGDRLMVECSVCGAMGEIVDPYAQELGETLICPYIWDDLSRVTWVEEDDATSPIEAVEEMGNG